VVRTFSPVYSQRVLTRDFQTSHAQDHKILVSLDIRNSALESATAYREIRIRDTGPLLTFDAAARRTTKPQYLVRLHVARSCPSDGHVTLASCYTLTYADETHAQ
jgi:hypothetical protein